jgi:hypothetical protein
MRVSILLSIFITISCSTVKANTDYVIYNKEIIDAERMFLNANYPASIAYYRRIINKYPKALLKDVFIATELACLIKDRENAMYFIKIAFQKGLNLKTVSMSNIIKNYLYYSDQQMKELSALIGHILNLYGKIYARNL